MEPNGTLLEYCHIVNGLYPLGDAFGVTVATRPVRLRNSERVTFVIQTGDAKFDSAFDVVTIEACDAADATNAVAMPFQWRTCPSSATVDTWSLPVIIPATGVAMVGLSNYMYAAEVTGPAVLQAGQGDTPPHLADWVRMVVTAAAQDLVTAGVIIILHGLKHAVTVPLTAIV